MELGKRGIVEGMFFGFIWRNLVPCFVFFRVNIPWGVKQFLFLENEKEFYFQNENRNEK